MSLSVNVISNLSMSYMKQALVRAGRLYVDQAGRPHIILPEWVHRTECAYSRLRRAIPFGGTPLRTKYDLSIRPFFIVGSGRSGSTLLRRILVRHSAIHIPPETYVLGHLVKEFRRNSQVRWRTLVRWMISEFVLHPEFPTFNISNVTPLLDELDELRKEYRSLAAILNAFYVYHAKINGLVCERWGDKTPINSFCLKRLESVFPSAQYIHIVRDGYDTVASYVAAGLYTDYEDAATRWVAATRQVESYLDRRQDGLTIRYEKLVTHPEAGARQVCEFLGISFEQPMTSVTSALSMGDVDKLSHHSGVKAEISAQSIGKGRRTLPIGAYAKIRKIIGPQMKRLGYEL